MEGIQVNGVDIIHWNASRRIVRLKVMVRPVRAPQTLIPLMAGELQRNRPDQEVRS